MRLSVGLAVMLGAVMTGLLLLGASGVKQAEAALPTQTVTPQPDSEGPVIPPLAMHGVTRNAEWTPLMWSFDGVDMMLVPAGCFTMGSPEWSPGGEALPAHELCLDEPYWIDRYEVTNVQFERFGGVAARENPWNDPDQPRQVIEPYEALDYCFLRGARLPTEVEWEYAARGPDDLIYPWGNEPDPENAVYGWRLDSEPAVVGSRPGGASWVGALDMIGNAQEGVASSIASYPYLPGSGNENWASRGVVRVIRGGSWQDGAATSYTRRDWSTEASPRPSTGFRCVRSVDMAFPESVTPISIPTVEAAVDAGALGIGASMLVLEPGPFFEAGQLNAEWTPLIATVGGAEMAYVPAGCSILGITQEQVDSDLQACRERNADYLPACTRFYSDKPRLVCFDGFWIDRYEVTNELFVKLGGVALAWSNWPDRNQPRENVTITEARYACARRGARLPTPDEWEYAARGPEGWLYPWGNEFDADNVVYGPNSNNETAPVGSRPDGASWVGALDMVGNVAEWMDGGSVKGSSWAHWFGLQAALQDAWYSGLMNWQVGFRCVRS